MDAQQLQRILASGEDSKHQFKREISRLDSLAAELAAFSNNGGGLIQADTLPIPDSTLADLDETAFNAYFP